jgi:YHS domain-containing protein
MHHHTALRNFVVLLLGALAAAVFVTAAHAGEFFEKDGVALRGYDAVAYVKENQAVKGSARYRAEHQGSVFLFSSPAHRDAFAADPTRYAPQYGGFCAYGMSKGYKAATDPAAFTVIDGKLYLNYNRDVQRQWSADVPGFVALADKQWPTAQRQTKVIE